VSLLLEFHPAVREELDDEFRWYEKQSPGLDVDFLLEVEQVLAQIAANPTRHGYADGEVRMGLLNRFPFAVYYRVLSDRIRVLAIFHSSRDPYIWQSRN